MHKVSLSDGKVGGILKVMMETNGEMQPFTSVGVPKSMR